MTKTTTKIWLSVTMTGISIEVVTCLVHGLKFHEPMSWTSLPLMLGTATWAYGLGRLHGKD
jgi:hypothetical protein